MTDQSDNTHSPTPAAEPLALRLSGGLGDEVEHAIDCASTATDMGARLPRAE